MANLIRYCKKILPGGLRRRCPFRALLGGDLCGVHANQERRIKGERRAVAIDAQGEAR